jgi:transcriptional regulator with XRE-family HTH domain
VEYISCGDEMNRVRESRLQKGLTQRELSKITKIRQAEISLIENDLKPNLSIPVAQRLAKALGKTMDYLFPY